MNRRNIPSNENLALVSQPLPLSTESYQSFLVKNTSESQLQVNQTNCFRKPNCIYQERQFVIFEDMSRSPPSHRSWHPPQGLPAGPPPMSGKSYDRRSPDYDHRPSAEWYRWHDQHRSRTPPRSSPPRGSPPRLPPRNYSPRPLSPHERTSTQRPHSPHGEHISSRRSPSPCQERAPSPRIDRSTKRPSPVRAPSPRRERPPSPRRDYHRGFYDWKPPPHHYAPPPWEGRRSRSPPPLWVRRSPPRYGPPRGRSPPRHWGPPPPEWDRYRGPPRSPQRWMPPPHHWERKFQGPPPAESHSGIRSSSHQLPPRRASPGPVPEVPKQDTVNKGDEGILPPGDDKEEDIDNYDLNEYDPEVPLGQKYVIAVSGFFCKICHKFYNSESSAKITHCKSKNHYDKFSKWLADKRVQALIQKRAASSIDHEEGQKHDEPPSKQIKIGPEVVDTLVEGKYDPSQPTASDMLLQQETTSGNGANMNETAIDNSIDEPKFGSSMMVDTSAEVAEDFAEQNGNVNQTNEYSSDSEVLITNETKTDDGFTEATLYNLRKMKVSELKANLEKRGMKPTGLKTVLLKRLEKVLLEEAAAESEQQIKVEEQIQNVKEEIGGGESESPTCEHREYVVKIVESDVDSNNRKTQWITEQEMRRELLQLEGVKKINAASNERKRVFNGRRTNVDWTITLIYEGAFPEDGLQFCMPSHQQLAYTAVLTRDTLV